MHIAKILKENNPSLSFEFFPPKTEETSSALFQTIKDLTPLHPSFVSVTYGAGGTTRDLTHDLVVKLHKETQLNVMAHLTCVNSTHDEIKEILDCYEKAGVMNIMALRGDPPKGETVYKSIKNGFNHTDELVEFIKKHHPNMGVGVAGFPEGHPECPNRLLEIEYLKRKVDAGADYICTQLFFNNDDFYDFKDRCELAGIDVPIVAGIMPISSRKSIKRMAELAAGARFPAKLLKALKRADDDEYAGKVGTHWASEQVRDLIDQDVAGIHFYTLNKSKATQHIYESLGIKNSKSLQKSST